MNYTVTWGSETLQLLADVWINAPDRDEVTRAADEIDHLLSVDPLGVGESRAGDKRILIHQPLAVYYTVDQTRRSVFVHDVWRV